MQSTLEHLLTAREAAARLGVKLDTLYAYVSRGLLRSVAVPGSRERHYEAEEVERFRQTRGSERLRPDPAPALMPVIDSAICLIENGRVYYRGADALRLSDSATLEEAAALLWGDYPHATSPAQTGERMTRPSTDPYLRSISNHLPPIVREGGVGESHPRTIGIIEQCQIRLAALASEDLAALDLSRGGVIRTGASILKAIVDVIAGTSGSAAPIHRRLAAAWGSVPPTDDLVRRALVLLADHELNASTFTARCVASTGATPYAVITAALAALSGRHHGGASARAEALFREIGEAADPMPILAARLARGERLPGMGQPLYKDGDPRARVLFAAIETTLPAAYPRISAAAEAARRLTGQHPNIDFALAATVTALRLPAGAALSLFIIARTVGWIAHTIEQYETRTLIRPRARYTGPRPSS